jgi:hypothetical protein
VAQTQNMTDEQFFDDVVRKIPGWLHDFTAFRTMDILKFQEKEKISGPLFEVGVFRGKYFSILLRSAIESGTTAFGLDTFQYAKQEDVKSSLRQFFNENISKAQYVQSTSSELDEKSLRELLGSKSRFISIDGSHEKNDVYLDLSVCDKSLSNEGVIAVYDFLNPLAIGVNEAIHLYFQVPRRVVPFAYLPNKLLLCRPLWSGRYRAILEAAVVGDSTSPIAANYRNKPSTRPLFGHEMLVAT